MNATIKYWEEKIEELKGLPAIAEETEDLSIAFRMMKANWKVYQSNPSTKALEYVTVWEPVLTNLRNKAVSKMIGALKA